ncbi:SRPBCC family protein [Kineococcus sp. NPDC059986]|uniref:SRPBCC family protein n=1 Tax=Kineococcus sp. NPDC059986 TaxID=3155538 RepID=UPI00344D0C63
MIVPPIVVVTDVAAPPQVLHDLVLDVDVHADSVRGSRERATTSTGRRTLAEGEEVTFRAWHLGVRWTMTSRVTAVERPHRVVDEQVRGPFRRLHHEHLFTARPGGTRMTDRMQVELPGGPLGALAVRLVAEPYLRRLLRRRAAHLRAVAERVTPPRP